MSEQWSLTMRASFRRRPPKSPRLCRTTSLIWTWMGSWTRWRSLWPTRPSWWTWWRPRIWASTPAKPRCSQPCMTTASLTPPILRKSRETTSCPITSMWEYSTATHQIKVMSATLNQNITIEMMQIFPLILRSLSWQSRIMTRRRLTFPICTAAILPRSKRLLRRWSTITNLWRGKVSVRQNLSSRLRILPRGRKRPMI